MKTLDSLTTDINDVLKNVINGDSHTISEELLAKFGSNVALKVKDSLTARNKVRPPNTIYASELGKQCNRQIWYGVHFPMLSEKIYPSLKIKFLYGDLLEELLLLLVEASGHEVSGQQDVIEFNYKGYTVRGRLDARIDGIVVDVKSASGYGFKKFQEGLNDSNDAFGYRAQLRVYTDSEEAGFLVINKENGQLCFSKVHGDFSLEDKLDTLIPALQQPVPPPRHFDALPEGTSGNMKLCTECSYCSYKRDCWKDSNDGVGLRAFSYSNKPVFLVVVAKEPKVTEITHLLEAA